MRDFGVIIHGPRGDEWERVLGTRTFRVRSPIPSIADLPGKPGAQVYMLDLDEITPAQREALITHLAAKFAIARELVAAEIDTGVPILDEDCTVIVHNPQRWLL